MKKKSHEKKNYMKKMKIMTIAIASVLKHLEGTLAQ